MSQVFSASGQLISQDKKSILKSGLKKIGIVALIGFLQLIIAPLAPEMSAWLTAHHVGVDGATLILGIDWIIKAIQKKYSETTYIVSNQE